MSDQQVTFGRVSRSTFSTNPELKTYVTDLVNRAYFNLHGKSTASADEQWLAAIVAAATQLCLTERVQQLGTRDLVQLFENVIRVSEEHVRAARRHTAMATNVFYLKETAFDAAFTATASHSASSVVLELSHTGRVHTEAPQEEDMV
jgi:cell division protein ZapA (FtsZ GTPase activity inhibitor)